MDWLRSFISLLLISGSYSISEPTTATDSDFLTTISYNIIERRTSDNETVDQDVGQTRSSETSILNNEMSTLIPGNQTSGSSEEALLPGVKSDDKSLHATIGNFRVNDLTTTTMPEGNTRLAYSLTDTSRSGEGMDKEDSSNKVPSKKTSPVEVEEIPSENSSTSVLTESRPHPNVSYSSVKVLIGEDHAIAVHDMSMKKRLSEIIKKENISVYSIDYLYKDGMVFLIAGGYMIRANLTNNFTLYDEEVIYDENTDGPISLAVEWVNNKLYWLAEKTQKVMMSNLDGSESRALADFTANFSYPNNIVVDPYYGNGSVFFVSNYIIYKSDLNLMTREVIALQGPIEGQEEWGIRCIALDRANQHLYFTGKTYDVDIHQFYMGRSKYDGSMANDFKVNSLWDINSMDILGDTIYYAQFNPVDKDIKSCPDMLMTFSTKNVQEKKDPSKIYVPRHCMSIIRSIKVYHQCAQASPNDEDCASFYNNI